MINSAQEKLNFKRKKVIYIVLYSLYFQHRLFINTIQSNMVMISLILQGILQFFGYNFLEFKKSKLSYYVLHQSYSMICSYFDDILISNLIYKSLLAIDSRSEDAMKQYILALQACNDAINSDAK